MAENTYNGWKNYQTWNVALWLGNDEGLYRSMREAAGATRFTGATIEEWVRANMPGGTPDLRRKHLSPGRDAYAGVHWPSIASMANEK